MTPVGLQRLRNLLRTYHETQLRLEDLDVAEHVTRLRSMRPLQLVVWCERQHRLAKIRRDTRRAERLLAQTCASLRLALSCRDRQRNGEG